MNYISDKFKPENIMVPSIFSTHHSSCQDKEGTLYFCNYCNFFYCENCSNEICNYCNDNIHCPECSSTINELNTHICLICFFMNIDLQNVYYCYECKKFIKSNDITLHNDHIIETERNRILVLVHETYPNIN